jgi:hypothetical protein
MHPTRDIRRDGIQRTRQVGRDIVSRESFGHVRPIIRENLDYLDRDIPLERQILMGDRLTDLRYFLEDML